MAAPTPTPQLIRLPAAELPAGKSPDTATLLSQLATATGPVGWTGQSENENDGARPTFDSHNAVQVHVLRPEAATFGCGGVMELWPRFPLIAAGLGRSLLDWGMLWVANPNAATERLTAVPAEADPLLWLLAATPQKQIAWQFPAGEHAPIGLSNAALPPLCPPLPPASTRWRVTLAQRLTKNQFPNPAREIEATAVRAGLLCWHDRLDDSHEHSQAIEGSGRHRNGDYWHAIMHRREGDYSNAKYWFRRVGPHPIFPDLARQSQALPGFAESSLEPLIAGGRWNPAAMVDACAAIKNDETSLRGQLLRQIQVIEQLLLLTQCCADASDQ